MDMLDLRNNLPPHRGVPERTRTMAGAHFRQHADVIPGLGLHESRRAPCLEQMS